ncbi:MAG: hypothetical protein AAB874_01010 [Patescibacteria group bacterium]
MSKHDRNPRHDDEMARHIKLSQIALSIIEDPITHGYAIFA